MELVLIRPRRKDNLREEFQIRVKDDFDLKQYRKLGKYSKDGKAEEWCHKEDFEYYKGERSNEID